MGDHREQLVDLSSAVGDVTRRREQVRVWLEDTGWAQSGEGISDWLHAEAPAARIGRRALRGRDAETVRSTVAVVADGPVWHAGDGTAPPACPTCRTRQPDWGDIEAWIADGSEPCLRCTECGYEALMGDWDLIASVAVGRLGIVIDFDSGEMLRAALSPVTLMADLKTELQSDLGGRWALVHRHI